MDILDTLWKVGLVLAVLLFGAVTVLRALFSSTDPAGHDDADQALVFAPHIDTGGTRLLGRGGDVNIQFGGAGNRNKQ